MGMAGSKNKGALCGSPYNKSPTIFGGVPGFGVEKGCLRHPNSKGPICGS